MLMLVVAISLGFWIVGSLRSQKRNVREYRIDDRPAYRRNWRRR